MKSGKLKRYICIMLCLCIMLQFIPVVTAATEAGPVITRQPQNATAALNEEISISLEAQGEGLKYQWYIKNKGSESFSKSSIKTDTYTTIMNATRADREIYCVITDALGNTVTSDIVTLIGEAKIPLEITRQPVSATANYSEEVRVSLEAQGEDLKYQWYLRNEGAEVFSKSSIKTDCYVVTMNKNRDGRELYCVITDALGNSVTTDIVTISKTPNRIMMFSPAPPTVTETTEPETESITEPIAEFVAEPTTEFVTEPVTEPITEPATEIVTEPATDFVSAAVIESVSEPVTVPGIEAVTEPAAEVSIEYEAEPEKQIVDITEKLNALMLKNAEELRRIRKEKGYLYACIYYYVKVTDAGDWDIKRTDEWKFEEGKTYVYQGVEMRMDDPGNIHFGYLGAILFHEEFVCFGAGLNNFMKFGRRDGDFSSYFDDPHDQTMMRWGYRMYTEGF